MVLPGDLAPIAARFWWGGVVLDQPPSRTSATLAHGSDGFFVHVQVHATLSVGVADIDEPVAVARNPQLGVVGPVLHGVGDGAQEPSEASEAGSLVPTGPPLKQPAQVGLGHPDVVALLGLPLMVGVEGPQVDAEGGPRGQRLVKEMHREVAGDATVREPAALSLGQRRRFGSAAALILPGLPGSPGVLVGVQGPV